MQLDRAAIDVGFLRSHPAEKQVRSLEPASEQSEPTLVKTATQHQQPEGETVGGALAEQQQSGGSLAEEAPPTMAWCNAESASSEAMRGGAWVPLDGAGASLEQSFCEDGRCPLSSVPGIPHYVGSDKLLEYQLPSCRLKRPDSVESMPAGLQVRMLGDSVARMFMGAFAARMVAITSGVVLKTWGEIPSKDTCCGIQHTQILRPEIYQGLMAAGFSDEAAAAAMNGGFPRTQHSDVPLDWWPLPGDRSISLIQLDYPPPEHLDASLHAGLFLGPHPLGEGDAAILGCWGAWLREGDQSGAQSTTGPTGDLVGVAQRAIVEYWRTALLSGKKMPRLIVMEPPAQHWSGTAGAYQGIGETMQCNQVQPQPSNTLFAEHRVGAFRAAAATSLDAAAYSILPVFWPLVERNDEHTFFYPSNQTLNYFTLTKYRDSGIIPQSDCTHYCQCSSAQRVFNSLLLAHLEV